MPSKKSEVSSPKYIEAIDRVTNVCKEFYDSKSTTNRMKILSKIIPSINSSTVIRPPFFCDIGSNIHFGDNIFINRNCECLDEANIILNDGVKIGPNCTLITVDHPLNPMLRQNNFENYRNIVLEKNVWLGANVIVLSGVTIGENSVVAAGSVVINDVGKNSLVAGNPARKVKNI